MTKNIRTQGVFISWVAFQRRSESVAGKLNLELKYFHYNWEEKHRYLKILSYLFKFINTLLWLVIKRPRLVVVQLAPTPPLYAAAIYSFFTNAPYISDCHNTMIYDGHWIKWPMAMFLLKRSSLVLVHNEEVRKKAKDKRINSFICLDPMPDIKVNNEISTIGSLDLHKENYILLPCNMAADDEPAEEFFKAAEKLPDQKFILTGFLEKVPAEKRSLASKNVHYTGFLKEDEFNALYKNASFAIVLSTREGTQPSGASEAIALGVPLIVTDLLTTRKIYKDEVVFTSNTTSGIIEAVEEMNINLDSYKNRILETKKRIDMQTTDQYYNLQRFINTVMNTREDIEMNLKETTA